MGMNNECTDELPIFLHAFIAKFFTRKYIDRIMLGKKVVMTSNMESAQSHLIFWHFLPIIFRIQKGFNIESTIVEPDFFIFLEFKMASNMEVH